MNFFTEKTDIWQYLKSSDKKIVLFGMGDGAEKIMRALDKIQREVSAVFASDEFVRGHSFKGFKVKKFSEILEEFDDFIILVSFASQSSIVIDKIIELSQKYELYAPDVPVYGQNLFTTDFLEQNREDINFVYDLLKDEESKKAFQNNINFKLTGKISYLIHDFSTQKHVYEQILHVSQNEIYVDLGAYNGDTIRELLSFTHNKYSKIIAFEPDKKNFKKLNKYIEKNELINIDTYNVGAHSCEDVLRFSNNSGRNSVLSTDGDREILVNSVDNILNGERATYIKYDVEGAEEQAIYGTKETLIKYKPKLNVALYHRSEDIFKIPKLIYSINPNYKFYIRQFPYIPAWDFLLFSC